MRKEINKWEQKRRYIAEEVGEGVGRSCTEVVHTTALIAFLEFQCYLIDLSSSASPLAVIDHMTPTDRSHDTHWWSK